MRRDGDTHVQEELDNVAKLAAECVPSEYVMTIFTPDCAFIKRISRFFFAYGIVYPCFTIGHSSSD